MQSNYLVFLSPCRVIIGAPKADTSQYQPGVREGGAVYRCDIADDNRCQIIQFDPNGKSKKRSHYVTLLTFNGKTRKALKQHLPVQQCKH
jgi:hypothetical protein